MMKLGIFFGGRSGEHEVSLMSATSVINAIDKEKYEIVMIGITKEGKWLLYDGPAEHIEDGSWQEEAEAALAADPEKYTITVLGTGGKSLRELIDFALPVLHGPYGEDGTIQGLFEMVDIPYGGCDVIGSALAMDKIAAKHVFSVMGIRQVPYVWIDSEDVPGLHGWLRRKIEERLIWPIFVKPANMGSSVGLSRVAEEKDLCPALELAAKYDRRIIIEQGVNCRELETAVLGNHVAKVGAVGEIIPSNEYYDYSSKYCDGGKTRLCIPADITEEQKKEIRATAVQAYKALDCKGYARVDFLMDKDTGEIYLNEINTIPGFTRYSMFPLLWAEAGLPYPKLIERIIELGMERYRMKCRQSVNR